MSPVISRTAACRRRWSIDRDTASRLGITPQMIDDTLYDAFGQRQVSTIFTQLNQYHVVLEVTPELQRNPDALTSIYLRSVNRCAGAVECVYPFRTGDNGAGRQSPGSVSRRHALLQPGARRGPG